MTATILQCDREALKPCPFCGGGPEIYTPAITLGDDEADVDYLQIVCKCRVTGGIFRFTDHNRRSANYLSAERAAIAAWNTRHDSTREMIQAAYKAGWQDGFLVGQFDGMPNVVTTPCAESLKDYLATLQGTDR